VPVGVQAHVEDEALPQPVHHVHPYATEQVIQQVDPQQHPAKARQRPEVARGDDFIEDLPQDLRRIEARPGHHEHAHETKRECRPVRAEVVREPNHHPAIGYAQRLNIFLVSARHLLVAAASSASSSMQHLRVTPTSEDDRLAR